VEARYGGRKPSRGCNAQPGAGGVGVRWRNARDEPREDFEESGPHDPTLLTSHMSTLQRHISEEARHRINLTTY
jgi:hypothetical protein